MERTSLLRGVACLVFAALLSPLSATPFSNLYFFGDSLSDTGNINNLTFGFYPAAPYFDGRFSNGPNWTETFASLQGFPNASKPGGMNLGPNFFNLTIAGEGGNNFAIGGARTDTTGTLDQFGIPSGVIWQAYNYLVGTQFQADPNGLYVFFGGGNDIRDASLLAPAARDAAAINSATYLAYTAYLLGQLGARNVLVLNAPNIGNTPEARIVRNNAASATAATQTFNAVLDAWLNYYLPTVAPGISYYTFDVYSAFESLYADTVSGGALYGMTNATSPCFAGYAGSTGSDCSVALFADDIHPSARTHQLLGQFVHESLQAQLSPSAARFASFNADPLIENPEPSSVLLMSSGFGLLLLAVRTKRKSMRRKP